MPAQAFNTPMYSLLNLAKSYHIGLFHEQFQIVLPDADAAFDQEVAIVKIYAGLYTGVGQGPNLYLARQMAATHLLLQLKTQTTEKVDDYGLAPGSDILTNVFKDLRDLCVIEGLHQPNYFEVNDDDDLDSYIPKEIIESDHIFCIKCQIGQLLTIGWSALPNIAKRWAAKKMFEALTNEIYPFADTRYGDSCFSLSDVGIEMSHLLQSKRKREFVEMEKHQLAKMYGPERAEEYVLKMEEEEMDKLNEMDLETDLTPPSVDFNKFAEKAKEKWNKVIGEELKKKATSDMGDKFILMNIEEK